MSGIDGGWGSISESCCNRLKLEITWREGQNRLANCKKNKIKGYGTGRVVTRVTTGAKMRVPHNWRMAVPVHDVGDMCLGELGVMG